MAKLNKKQLQNAIHGINDINKIVKKICGEKLGGGLYRDVYVYKLNPDYVVKIERDPSTGAFANVAEYLNYQNNQYWEWFEQWLAPCLFITETGQTMIQKRIEHKRRKDYPKYIPACFTDLKLKNFGFIGDRFVCCDYSYIPTFVAQIGKKSMKYAKWWGSLKD